MPLGLFIVKKPLPLISMSRGVEASDMLSPWVNCCAAVTTCTPSPPVVVLRLTALDAYTSANSACESLKPMVFALAMLLEVTSKAVLAADSPDKAMLKLDMRVLLKELVGYLLNAAIRHAAESRDVQGESGRARAHGDAVHGSIDQRGDRGAAGDTRDLGAQCVGAGGRGRAAGRFAVP